MNPALIVPVMYTNNPRSARNAVQVFDHPSSLHEEGELPRLLESLSKLEEQCQIILLVSCERELDLRATQKVQEITERFDNLNCIVIGYAEHLLVQQRFEQLGLPALNKEIGLGSYSALRNLGLVIACVLGFDAVVFLDDDEYIDDPTFLAKAMYGLGKLTPKGIPILVKSGFYLNAQGSYLSSQEDHWYNHFWQQAHAFNTWITRAMKGPRLSRSNHVCGGCLAIHKEAFRRLSFDPWVVRGEDLDYMLNLRMYGSDIWFDNTWYLHHLPPATKSEGLRFKQDIFRWLYEQRKIEFSKTQIDLLRVKPSSLNPYPGPFLESGIDMRIRITAFLRSLVSNDRKHYRQAMRAIGSEAKAYAQRNCNKYFEFQYVWPELMNRVENDTILKGALLQSSARRVSNKRKEEMEEALAASIDPGLTSEIRLNLAE